jgi:hypothetical protein
MLFQCIFASLGTEFLETITTEATRYDVADLSGATESNHHEGSCGHKSDRILHSHRPFFLG